MNNLSNALTGIAVALTVSICNDALAKDGGRRTTDMIAVEERVSGYPGAARYADIIEKHARANDVPLPLAHAVVRVESNYDAEARGAAGEIGLMQIKLPTARLMGYRGSASGLYDPETNIKYGMKYLGKARRLGRGDTCGTILRYNAGHGATRMNPVSRRYCGKVQAFLK